MKLKKIVSLALAGVLAVSMLAGCSNGTGSSSSTPTQEPAVKDLVSQVVANLNEDTSVDFAADTALQTAVEKYVAYKGNETTSGYEISDLNQFYHSEYDDALAKVTSDDIAKKEDTGIYVKFYAADAVADANVTYVAENLAKKVANEVACDTVTTNKLAQKYDAGSNGKYYTFEYTGKVAVAAVADETKNTTGYLVAYTITRTATEHLK